MMFDPVDHSRVFACPPGVDFPKALVDGLRARQKNRPPTEMARITVFVNTRRMQRRISGLFDTGPAGLVPKIRVVTDLCNDPVAADLPGAVCALRRRLELSQLVSRLLDKEPDLAPRSALFDLADSLALLLEEMHHEDVSPAAIFSLDVSDRSGHWQRSLKFLDIVSRFFGDTSGEAPDQAARQRRVTEHLIAGWAECPPPDPVIVAGSTGSRGSTSLLMQSVARLPQGAIILPGFDFDLPAPVWDHLQNPLTSEDHPQFRFRQLLDKCEISVRQVRPWLDDLAPPARARNKLVSLALRPAPVTDQWMQEGPALRNVTQAARNMALIEAPSERSEAVAIALALREAAERGVTAALVTPDRLLSRRVRAALDRWQIEPDVSAGDPLDQSPPGRFLRSVAGLFGTTLTSEALLIVLKHPLAGAGGTDRQKHLQWTRELELSIRRYGPPFPTRTDILSWAARGEGTAERSAWALWVTQTVFDLDQAGNRPLSQHLDQHLDVARTLVSGVGGASSDALWGQAAGQEALRLIEEFRQQASYGGSLGPKDYAALFHGVLKRGEVRDPLRPHPNIMIWGTLEARVQGAELVILGGLNDGTWPELSAPDPWLNREMRHKAGLLVPERRIGLSAHDFQQAIAAKDVILSRAVRNAETQTVASRWLNRLTNLMAGMSDEGLNSLNDMRRRGQAWLDMVAALEKPVPVAPQPRPSPMPPLKARPRSLSVTAVSRLIRDPYAIYAQEVLRLRPLDPLRQQPNPALRGTVLHKVLEEFIRDADFLTNSEALRSRLMQTADNVLQKLVPWPAIRHIWWAKLDRVADVFLSGEVLRQAKGRPVFLEHRGAFWFSEHDFTLKATADRIDKAADGSYIIYDYKTGTVPSKPQLQYFDKQLLLEAVLAEAGGFQSLPAGRVTEVAYIGVGSKPTFKPVELAPGEISKTRAEFLNLISGYQTRAQGYTSRRAMAEVNYGGDYDHLARFGEWDESKPAAPGKVGK